jgi:hypothetical protein
MGSGILINRNVTERRLARRIEEIRKFTVDIPRLTSMTGKNTNNFWSY